MLIRDLEIKTGLERATIRFYEKEGIITPERKENGYRMYSQADCDTLLKVKLLRQLGMPLEKIKGLQQGSEDFSQALAEQISILENQIQTAGRAKEVCAEIRSAGADYASLDASYYLARLTRPASTGPQWTPRPVPEFRQPVVAYPWKRYFARLIDLLVLRIALLFLVVVVLRVRPLNGFFVFLSIFIVQYLIWIPVEGVLVHYLGTTPGKWLMGIHIESINGGPLPLSNAMHRAWDTLRYGYGFDLPIYWIWCLYRSYRDYKDLGYTQWDYEWGAEYQFSYYYSTEKKAGMGLLIALCLVAFGFSVSDSIRPVHRGEDLTIAQFVQNYNLLLDEASDDGSFLDNMYLKEDGTWRTWYRANNAIYIDIYGKAIIIHENGSWEEGYNDLEYTLENGMIRSISYHQTWEDVFMFSPFEGRIDGVIASVASAQDWFNVISFYDFQQELINQLKKEEGSFTYNNLEIRWSTDSVNCNFSDGVFYDSDENTVSSVSLDFEIIIHPSK